MLLGMFHGQRNVTLARGTRIKLNEMNVLVQATDLKYPEVYSVWFLTPQGVDTLDQTTVFLLNRQNLQKH